MPLRFLRGRLTRLLLTILGVACAVALICAIDLVNRAVFAAFAEIVDAMAGRAALQVAAGEGSLFPEELADEIAVVPGVELAVPVVTGSAFLPGGGGDVITVHGIDITNEGAVRVYEPDEGTRPELEDPLVFLSQPDSIAITKDFAARHRLTLDDRLELETPTGRRTFTVRGLLAPRGIARVQGGNIVVMDIAAAELAFTRPGLVNRVDVVVRRDADVWNVADAITAILPPGLRVEAPAQRKADLQKVMQSIQIALQAVGYFGLVAAFLIAFSRLTAVFEARAWELAVLRAAGVRAGVVWWELTKESLAVACAGVLLGIPAGIGLGRLMLPIIATTTALSSKLIVANVEATVQWRSVLLAASVGVGAVFLAALLPAWRAARVPVVDSLRARRVELTSDATWGPSWMRLFVLVVAVLCLGLHIATESASVGLAATAFCAVASAAFARPMLAWLGGPLLLFGPRVFGAPGKFGIAALLASPRRTALAISTIGVGFGTVLWWWIVAASFERSVVEVMPGVLRGDLAVSSANIGAGYLEAPVDESLVSELTAIPGVRAAAGERAVDWPLAGDMIAINAFDPAYFDDPAFGEWPLVGRHLPDAAAAVARGEAVLVSENFVRHLKMDVGDVVTLETPTGPLQLRIAGVTRDFLSPRGTIEMSRETYRTRWRDPHLLRALVRVGPGEDPDRVKQAIAASLGRRYSLKIISIRTLIDWFVEQVHRAFAAFHVLGLLVLVLVMVGVGDALAAGTLERTRDFGVIRAVGIRRRLLARTVLTEALVLGLLGFALALALGSTLGLLWVTETFPALLGWTLVLDVPGARIAGVAVAILVACLLSGYVPAARAARLNPVVALRTE